MYIKTDLIPVQSNPCWSICKKTSEFKVIRVGRFVKKTSEFKVIRVGRFVKTSESKKGTSTFADM